MKRISLSVLVVPATLFLSCSKSSNESAYFDSVLDMYVQNSEH